MVLSPVLQPVPAGRRRARLVKLVLLMAAVLIVVAMLARGYDLKALVDSGLSLLRTAGGPVFFLCMALLPAVGVPLSFFTLTAGSAFGPTLGMPLVTVLALTAIGVNICLSYVLARHAFRPLVLRLVYALGYSLPPIAKGEVNDLIVLLRVAPGLPFPVQNYLLGIAEVPFWRYLAISCLIAFPIAAAFIFFGEALLQGRGRMALLGLLLLMALMVVIHMVRRRLRARQLPPA